MVYQIWQRTENHFHNAPCCKMPRVPLGTFLRMGTAEQTADFLGKFYRIFIEGSYGAIEKGYCTKRGYNFIVYI